MKKHGYSGTPTYKSWKMMKQRCNLKSTKNYHRYGGRGISYDEKWEIFENFLSDMGEREIGKTLDKIDNDKNYSKENCRWATIKEQARNRPHVKMITYKGKTQCIRDWGEEYGIPRTTMWNRIVKYGWNIEKALQK